MQITSDKCGGAPGGRCNDPDFNVRTGTKYFATVLANHGGSVLEAIGEYNGWYKGMTVVSLGFLLILATAHLFSGQRTFPTLLPTELGLVRISYRSLFLVSSLCSLQQFVNGWIQGLSGYDLGHYHNGGNCAS